MFGSPKLWPELISPQSEPTWTEPSIWTAVACERLDSLFAFAEASGAFVGTTRGQGRTFFAVSSGFLRCFFGKSPKQPRTNPERTPNKPTSWCEGEHKMSAAWKRVFANEKARPFGDRLFDVFSYSRCSEGDVVAVGILEVVLQGVEVGHGLYLEGFAIFAFPLVMD